MVKDAYYSIPEACRRCNKLSKENVINIANTINGSKENVQPNETH